MDVWVKFNEETIGFHPNVDCGLGLETRDWTNLDMELDLSQITQSECVDRNEKVPYTHIHI